MSDMLTRNFYRCTDVERLPATGIVCFDLWIGRTWARYGLPPEEFTALTEDLGLRPTSPAATEYESVSIYRKEGSGILPEPF